MRDAKYWVGGLLAVLAVGAVALTAPSNDVKVGPAMIAGTTTTSTSAGNASSTASGTAVLGTETSTGAVATGTAVYGAATTDDLPPQAPLPNPPSVIKGIYLTAWVAGSPARVAQIINLIKSSELNAVVIDIKDYSGYVSYTMDVPEVKASGAESQIRIARPNALIKELHDNGIYAIGRITDFQDPILAKAHPEWALHNKAGGVWKDNNGIAWMDPAAPPVWDYLGSIAKDAFARGFDEVNFDYIRFASDGALGQISYPYYDGKTAKAKVIANYFKYLRQTFPNNRISADLFGLATVNDDDLGIGQIIQTAYEYFDYICPMVYPSHYASGFLGYTHPAAYPYEVIDYSLAHAMTKLLAMGESNANSTTVVFPAASTTASGTATGAVASSTKAKAVTSPYALGYVPNTKLRPWLQDFNLGSGPGATYTPAMVKEEKQATYDAVQAKDDGTYYGGWLLWNAASIYTSAELEPKQ